MKSEIVVTTHGAVQGEIRNSVRIFRGIPYGGSCDADRRFLPPVPAQNWAGIRDCSINGFYARQYGTSISGSEDFGAYFSGGKPELFGVAEEQQSENCLVLNILTPAVDDIKRPVAVYIHGGGFTTGSGTLVLGADRWVAEENIVLVGINHRLNIFGYLYLGHLDEKYASSGMAGMLDLVLALQWVRDNIASFGGDPDSVTIMGESGGGMKVSTLLAMPEAQGLFHKAIVESGSAPVGVYSVEEAKAVADRVLTKLNISISELSQLSSDSILAASQGEHFTPVADSIHLNHNVTGGYFAPEISKDIPLLVGSSEDEMGAFINPDLPITWENLKAELLKINNSGSQLWRTPITEENVDAVIRVFRENNPKNDDPWHTYVRILSVGGILGGGAFCQAMAKARQGGAPVYHYAVTYDAPLASKPSKYCAWHTADLPLQMRIVLHPECEEISRMLASSFASFIRNGTPGWQAFDSLTRKVMVFDNVCRVETDPWKTLRESMHL